MNEEVVKNGRTEMEAPECKDERKGCIVSKREYSLVSVYSVWMGAWVGREEN